MNGNNRQRRLNLNHGVCSSSSSNNNNNSESTTASTNRPPQLSTTTTTTTTLHGVQFTIETQEGVRWAVFASELATLTFDTQTRTTIVVSAENGGAFTGVLRFAILPPTRDQLHGSDSVTTQTSTALHQILDSSGMKRLIYHAGVYPVSGAVHWSFRSVGSASNGADGITDLPTNVLNALSGNSQSSSSSSTTASSTTAETGKSNNRVGVVDFKFETRSFTPTTTGPKTLLMLALPHHAQSLPLSSQLDRDNFELVYTCIKGPMRPVLGSEWSYEEPLPSLGFDGDTGSNSDRLFVSPNVRAKILTSLVEDVKLALPTATENIYGFGKQAARLAQLAHIAHVLLLNGGKNTTTMTTASPVPQNPVPPQPSESENADENANAIASSVLQEAKNILRDSLDNFLRSKVADSLVFDANLGGMVTTDGLLNSNADFGNGRYNDHHFHYGYLLYACAVMGKLDPLFVEEFGDAVGTQL